MRTRLTYLECPTDLVGSAKMIGLTAAAGATHGIELDRTPAYPQSGGQPGDKARIVWSTGFLDVENVRYHDERVMHIGTLSGELPEVGTGVVVTVDQVTRSLHTRLHSGGELICAAIHDLEYHWRVSGANHFPGTSKVSFMANLDANGRDVLGRALSTRLSELIAANGEVIVRSTMDRKKAISLVGEVPDGIAPDEAVRMVFTTPSFGRPCSGTHVSHTGEIGKIILRSLKCKGGELHVGYDVAA